MSIRQNKINKLDPQKRRGKKCNRKEYIVKWMNGKGQRKRQEEKGKTNEERIRKSRGKT